jgi:hypothetical protein
MIMAIRACVGLLLMLCSLLGADPDYFPLHPGNQWVYRCTGLCAEPLSVIGVSRTDFIAGRWYFLLDGFHGKQALLRQDDSGTVWSLNRETGAESRWYAFGTTEGTGYETSIDPCSRRATVASRSHRYEGRAGTFPATLQIRYEPGPCSDAGLTEEVFHQWTGLVRRTETTIAGPRTYDLVYARTGGVTVISQPELHFSLSLDRSVYTVNLMPPVDPNLSIPRMTARLTLRNTTDKPITLQFSSGQRYDLELKNENGDVMYRWSDDKVFTMALGEEAIGPGERSYAIIVPLQDKRSKPLDPGKYTASGWITTSGQQPYKASVGFEIRHVY